jgi:hypothetical protein
MEQKGPVLVVEGEQFFSRQNTATNLRQRKALSTSRLLLQILCDVHSERAPAKNAVAERHAKFAGGLPGIATIGVCFQATVGCFANILKPALVALKVFGAVHRRDDSFDLFYVFLCQLHFNAPSMPSMWQLMAPGFQQEMAP